MRRKRYFISGGRICARDQGEAIARHIVGAAIRKTCGTYRLVVIIVLHRSGNLRGGITVADAQGQLRGVVIVVGAVRKVKHTGKVQSVFASRCQLGCPKTRCDIVVVVVIELSVSAFVHSIALDHHRIALADRRGRIVGLLHRFRYRIVGIVEHKGGRHAKQHECRHGKQDGENQADRLALKTACAHLDGVSEREARLDKLGLAAVILLGLDQFGVLKGLLAAVFIDLTGALDAGHILLVGGDDHLALLPAKHLADLFHLGVGQCFGVFDGDGVFGNHRDVFLLSRRLVLRNGFARKCCGRVVEFADVRNDLAVFELDDTVAVVLGKFPIVRDHDDQLLFGKLLQGVQNLLTGVGVQSACRFIRHDDLGFLNKSARDRDPLFLTARKRVGLAFCVAGKVHLLQKIGNRLFVVGFALELQSKRDVLFDRKFV